MDFRKSEDINKALISKLGWLIFNSSRKALEKTSRKQICRPKELLIKSSCKIIGNDLDTKVWLDPWLPNVEVFIPKLRKGGNQDFSPYG